MTAATLSTCYRLSIVARFGVGYDNVDVEACTESNVFLTITPDGVRRPVAVSAPEMQVVRALLPAPTVAGGTALSCHPRRSDKPKRFKEPPVN